MAQQEVKQWTGLDTASNVLAQQPGSLLRADNCLLLQANKIESRPGYVPVLPLLAGEHNLTSLYVRLNAALGEQLTWATTDNGDLISAAVNATTWSAVSQNKSYLPPPGALAPTWVSLTGSDYVSTTTGTQKIDPSLVPARAGQDPASSTVGSVASAGGQGALNANASVSYRVTLAHYDANNILIESVPTGRLILFNPGASIEQATVNAQLPASTTSNTIIRLWRTKQYDQTLPVAPDDLHYLVAQRFATSTDLSNLVATFVDNQPDALLYQLALYTNTIGIQRAYANPPMAAGLEQYRNRIWYGNTRQPGTVNTTCVGTGTATSLSAGDTVTVAGIVFVGVASGGTPNPGQFQVFTAGTPAQNIEATTRDLCRAVNIYFATLSNPPGQNGVRVQCSYTSGFNAAPGAIQFFEVGVGSPAWTVTSTKPAGFVPPLPITSDAIVRPARVYYSEDGQPDAVPLFNYLDVGDQGAPILALTRIGNTLFVHKTDGLWKITGFTPTDFTVQLVSNEVKLINGRCIGRFSNFLFALTRLGVYAVSEAGITPVSQQIDDQFAALNGILEQFPNLANNCWATGKEMRHYAIFGIPGSAGDVGCSVQLVYATTTGAWTTWSKASTYGASTDRLGQVTLWTVPTSSSQGRVLRESVRGDYLDYADERVAITTPPAGTGLTWTFNTTLANGFVDGVPLYQVNGVISQPSSNSLALITGVTYGALSGGVYPVTITFDAVYPWAATSGTYYKPIQATVRPGPLWGESPMVMKDWKQVFVLWQFNSARNTLCSLCTEVTSTDSMQFRPTAIPVAFGTQPFGTKGFGGRSSFSRTEIAPQIADYGHGCLLNLTMYIGEALQPWALGSIVALYEMGGEPLKS